MEGVSDGEHRSVLDKSWVEGRDFHRAEQSIICHDGESIQGSHVAGSICTYVLQWRFSGPHLDLLDSITSSPKAQVMYYYEVLSSADYRYTRNYLTSCRVNNLTQSMHLTAHI